MTKEECNIIYKTTKECYDKDILVFEKCEYVCIYFDIVSI